ncbi:UNVERIFIED_CONTAM: hypothetical protein K2H54_020206 [Gekko kuhli]
MTVDTNGRKNLHTEVIVTRDSEEAGFLDMFRDAQAFESEVFAADPKLRFCCYYYLSAPSRNYRDGDS